MIELIYKFYHQDSQTPINFFFYFISLNFRIINQENLFIYEFFYIIFFFFFFLYHFKIISLNHIEYEMEKVVMRVYGFASMAMSLIDKKKYERKMY
jgi:hypothetical protein